MYTMFLSVLLIPPQGTFYNCNNRYKIYSITIFRGKIQWHLHSLKLLISIPFMLSLQNWNCKPIKLSPPLPGTNHHSTLSLCLWLFLMPRILRWIRQCSSFYNWLSPLYSMPPKHILVQMCQNSVSIPDYIPLYLYAASCHPVCPYKWHLSGFLWPVWLMLLYILSHFTVTQVH